jgi:hypothetical protein
MTRGWPCGLVDLYAEQVDPWLLAQMKVFKNAPGPDHETPSERTNSVSNTADIISLVKVLGR